MARATIDESAEGRKVVHGDETVGRVVEVRHGTAYVEPDPGIAETVMSKLGWADADEDTYPLQESAIAEVTDDEIRLRRSV
jgi:hypothetical protein